MKKDAIDLVGDLAAVFQQLEGDDFDDGSTRIVSRDAEDEHEEPNARDSGPRDTTITLTRDGRMLRVEVVIEMPRPGSS